MDGPALDLTLFLLTTFVAAAVAGLAGFAFGLVAAAGWLHILTPLQTATLIIAFGLVVQVAWAADAARRNVARVATLWTSRRDALSQARPHAAACVRRQSGGLKEKAMLAKIFFLPPWWSACAAAWVVVIAACLLHGTAGLAQDDAKVRAGLETWQSSGCVDCHGPFADGERDDDDYPMGANLRTTRLDAAAITLTIMCGRPGTGMPSFDGGAYTVRACYGRPLGAAPDNLQPTPRTLRLDEIDALVTYLRARIVGRGKVTREECLFYYDGKADCDDFK